MKTHLLTKKRALISSVAMLLVAIIALGTATFAWFTKSTAATASGLTVETVKASEIQLSKTTGDWTDTLDYAAGTKILKPASSADGAAWFAANAAGKASYAADTATITDISSTVSTNPTNNGYVYKEQLNVRNNGGAAINNVKIKFTLSETEAGTSGKYARVALVEVDKRGTDAAITGTFTDGVYAAGTDTADAFTNTDGSATTVAAKGTGVFDVGSLAANTDATGSVKYYNLYVWFEGQDTDCKDSTAGNQMPDISFTVTGDTVTQG